MGVSPTASGDAHSTLCLALPYRIVRMKPTLHLQDPVSLPAFLPLLLSWMFVDDLLRT